MGIRQGLERGVNVSHPPRSICGAYFSPCRRWRYALWRFWAPQPLLHFIMLNPSTADENANDPTVERCERRAHDWGYGGVIVTNVFAWRSTDPRGLHDTEDPVGPENDAVIPRAALAARDTICAWGVHGRERGMVLVEGVNVKKKHQKPRGRNARRGQILDKSLPIHVSNVMLVDPKSGKPTRVGLLRKDGERVRIAKKSKAELQ